MEIIVNSLAGLFDGYQYIQGPISISIEKGKISQINRNIDVGSDIVIDGSGKIATVPFHDAHTHLIFGGERFFEIDMKVKGRSYSEILEKGGGIKHTMRESREASDEVLKNALIQRLDTMLSHGSLMIEAKSGYGLSTEEELRQLRILNEVNKIHPVELVPTFGGAHVPPPDYSRMQYVEDIISDILPIVKKEKLATSTDVFCDRGAFTVDETRMIFDRSKELSIPVRVHAEELEYTGIGKIAANEYKALSADHLLLAKKDDFEVLANHKTVATFMPLAPIGLFSNQQPQGWQETDVILGLGSDFNPNNWIVSMQTAIRMAVFRYRMTPLQAIRAATSGSYTSMTGTRQDKLGVGKTANLLLLNAKSLEEFSAKIGQNLVSHVIKDGKILIENSHKTV